MAGKQDGHSQSGKPTTLIFQPDFKPPPLGNNNSQVKALTKILLSSLSASPVENSRKQVFR
jgi:hypothetical protein